MSLDQESASGISDSESDADTEKNIQPLTFDLINELPFEERKIALVRYHEWLREVRKRDKKGHWNEIKKIRYFNERKGKPVKVRVVKTKEEKNELARQYYLKNKDVLKKRKTKRRKERYRTDEQFRKKISECSKRWHLKNKDTKVKEYFIANKDLINKRAREKYKRKKEERINANKRILPEVLSGTQG